MTAGVFRVSTDLDVLKGISRNLLARFLAPFAAELAAQHINLPSSSLGDTEYLLRAAEILSSSAELPKPLTQTLHAIAVMAAPQVQPATPASPSQRYVICKGSGFWQITFDGETAVIKHERGMFYVGYLLLHPFETSIHAVDLMSKIPEMYRKQLGLGEI